MLSVGIFCFARNSSSSFVQKTTSFATKGFSFSNSSRLSSNDSLETILDNVFYTYVFSHPVETSAIPSSFQPKIYFYNSHPEEEYQADFENGFSIAPNVTVTNYILQEEFKKRGIDVVVEEKSATDVLNANGWKYAKSYDATRTFLESAILQYPTLEYFVDLHRDSVSRSISTVEIGNRNYAKVMFLIGMENEHHAANEALTSQIETYLNNHYEGISRGIYRKSGAGVNGVYNQDFNDNTILIEIGGMENTLEEVYNTCLAIAEALYAVMMGT